MQADHIRPQQAHVQDVKDVKGVKGVKVGENVELLMLG